MFLKRIPVGSLETNCYLLVDEDTKAAAVIDPGGDAPHILAAVAEARAAVKKILLTHGHFDHTGAVAELRSRLGAEVYLHGADAALLGRDRFFPAIGETRPWGEGDIVAVGGLHLEVLHTPGHTPGSVCLKCGDVLLTGDTLFAGSMGRTDFTGGSGAEMMASLKRLGGLAGDADIYPGHGESSTLERERRSNPYLRMAMGAAE